MVCSILGLFFNKISQHNLFCNSIVLSLSFILTMSLKLFLSPSKNNNMYSKLKDIAHNPIVNNVFVTDDHRMLVEPACGASLAAIYNDIVSNLQSEGKLGPVTSALVVVCGGSNVSLDSLQSWKKEFDL